MKSLRFLAASSIVLGAVIVGAVTADSAGAAPRYESDNMGAVLKGAKRYIVRFADSMKPSDIDAVVRNSERGGRAKERLEYSKVFKGSVIDMKPAALQALLRSGKVVWAEPDQQVRASATQDASQLWGLDRIDQRALPLDGGYTYDSNGAGVTAYVVDTGILATHNDFGSRVRAGYDALGGDTVDCNGHGTHVAGTVGGSTYGVAKGVELVSIRVLDCMGSGSSSGVIAGIDWAIADHVSGPAVLNMSLGGGSSASLNAAVDRAVADGITVVVAAGNSNADACTASPASALSALTVGSTTSADARSSFSNYGSCVDIFAPGSSITSAYYTGNSAVATLSGTSMASPHVAGAVARYLGLNPSATPSQVNAAVVAQATTNVVSSPGVDSPNYLLNSNFAAPVAPTTTTTASTTTTLAPTTTVVTTTTSASPSTTVSPTTTTPVGSTTTAPSSTTTSTMPSTTTTEVPRVRPVAPTNVTASYSPERRYVTLSWVDDPATRATLIGHVVTVYVGDTPVAVLPNGSRGQQARIKVRQQRFASLTLSFTVSAVNRQGISAASARSNSVTIPARRSNSDESSASTYYFED